MMNFRVIDLLREIEGYDVIRDNAIDFILQEKGRGDDLALFYCKSSLLQLIKSKKHLDKMIEFYYGLENDCLMFNDIYSNFISGNIDELSSIFKLADSLFFEFCKFGDYIKFNSCIELEFKDILDKIRKLDYLVECKCIELENIASMEGVEYLSDEAIRVRNKVNCLNEQIREQVIVLENLFKSVGAVRLLEKMNFSVAVREKELDWEIICERFELRFSSCYDFVCFYHWLIDDIVMYTRVIKNYSKIVDIIIETKDLSRVIFAIREVLFPGSVQKFRNVKLIGNNFMKYTSLPENVLEDFDKLSIQFRDVLDEEDVDCFIRKCADFHYDFLLVHPYNDGNGRMARILLSTMFLSRNIMLPSLYYSNFEKDAFYLNSNVALEGDYKNIEQDLYARLGHYYPIVMPDISNVKKCYGRKR